MQEFMKMIEELIKNMTGNNERNESELSDNSDENAEDTGKSSRVKKACASVLAGMRREIHVLGKEIMRINARRDALIEEHDSLVDEIRQLDGMFANVGTATPAAAPVDSGSSEGPKLSAFPPVENPVPPSDGNPVPPVDPQAPVPPWSAEKNNGDGPAHNPKCGRKPKEKEKEKVEPKHERLSRHRSTGNSRLDTLETALHDALERLNNAKMAFHFMAIKDVRLALTDLYKAWDKPEDERITELEAGLKDAVDKLSANPNAAKSKIMPEIWGDIIVALQNKDASNQ